MQNKNIKCALCANCKVFIVSNQDEQLKRPEMTNDIALNGFNMFNFLINKYSGSIKIKRYVKCRKWLQSYPYRQGVHRERMKCDDYDPDDLDADDNKIDVAAYMDGLLKKEHLLTGFNLKYKKSDKGKTKSEK